MAAFGLMEDAFESLAVGDDRKQDRQSVEDVLVSVKPMMMSRQPLEVEGHRRGVPQGGTGNGGSPAEGSLRGGPTARGVWL